MLNRKQFEQNLIEALEAHDFYVPNEQIKEFLDLNYDEDSSIAKWSFADFNEFASNLGDAIDFWDLCRSYDFHYPNEDEDRVDVVYEVHSDIDENNVYNEFDTAENAIKYAKECDAQCWVDIVTYDAYTGAFLESETIWAYNEDDDNEEEE